MTTTNFDFVYFNPNTEFPMTFAEFEDAEMRASFEFMRINAMVAEERTAVANAIKNIEASTDANSPETQMRINQMWAILEDIDRNIFRISNSGNGIIPMREATRDGDTNKAEFIMDRIMREVNDIAETHMRIRDWREI
jgi:hypothetical protein